MTLVQTLQEPGILFSDPTGGNELEITSGCWMKSEIEQYYLITEVNTKWNSYRLKLKS